MVRGLRPRAPDPPSKTGDLPGQPPRALPANLTRRQGQASLRSIASRPLPERYVATELRGLDVFWQVRVIDDDGAVVMYGFRAGPGGTGERWTWRPPSPPAGSPATRIATAHSAN
jgi:hypothetical protein